MIEIVVMKESEFQGARDRLKEILHDIRSRGSEAAAILSRMSHPQLQIVKQDFKGIWSADQIERLALFGRGIISDWLATRQKTLPASVLKRLPEKALEVLNNPESEVEVLTDKGVKIRQVHTMSSVELAQVVDPKKGILKAEEQFKRHLIQPKKIDTTDIEDAESVKLSEDRKYLLVKSKLVTVRIPMKTLRKVVA